MDVPVIKGPELSQKGQVQASDTGELNIASFV